MDQSEKNLAKRRRQSAPRRPPTIRVPGSVSEGLSGEKLDEAILRYQRAKATTEELDAARREVELNRLRGALIPAEEARDALEAAHLRWVAELDQLSAATIAALPIEFPASQRETVRKSIDDACCEIRKRISGVQS